MEANEKPTSPLISRRTFLTVLTGGAGAVVLNCSEGTKESLTQVFTEAIGGPKVTYDTLKESKPIQTVISDKFKSIAVVKEATVGGKEQFRDIEMVIEITGTKEKISAYYIISRYVGQGDDKFDFQFGSTNVDPSINRETLRKDFIHDLEEYLSNKNLNSMDIHKEMRNNDAPWNGGSDKIFEYLQNKAPSLSDLLLAKIHDSLVAANTDVSPDTNNLSARE